MIQLQHDVAAPCDSHLRPLAARRFKDVRRRRTGAGWCRPSRGRGRRLADQNGKGIAGLDPIAGTEALAFDFLAKGGKHSRPFITLAVHDALTGAKGTEAQWSRASGQPARCGPSNRHVDRDVSQSFAGSRRHRGRRPVSLRRGDVASQVRHGHGHQRGRLPDRHGLSAGEPGIAHALGAEVVADIVDCLADAHTKLIRRTRCRVDCGATRSTND